MRWPALFAALALSLSAQAKAPGVHTKTKHAKAETIELLRYT